MLLTISYVKYTISRKRLHKIIVVNNIVFVQKPSQTLNSRTSSLKLNHRTCYLNMFDLKLHVKSHDFVGT